MIQVLYRFNIRFQVFPDIRALIVCAACCGRAVMGQAWRQPRAAAANVSRHRWKAGHAGKAASATACERAPRCGHEFTITEVIESARLHALQCGC